MERTIQRVEGVRGIAPELDVKLSAEHKRSDTEIAQAAATSLRINSLVPSDKIKVKVEDGWVTLTGEVDWSCKGLTPGQAVVVYPPAALADGRTVQVRTPATD